MVVVGLGVGLRLTLRLRLTLVTFFSRYSSGDHGQASHGEVGDALHA